MTKTRVLFITSLSLLALLVPSSSAKASLNPVPFCASLHPGTSNQWDPVTVAPGKVCTFFPVAVNHFSVSWSITKPGSGAVCAGVVQSPPGYPNGSPLDPVTGAPIGWGVPGKSPCVDISRFGAIVWAAQNGFNAVYGQPVVLNFSTATIKTDNRCCFLYYYS
jgi:hypothetical protein